VVLTDEINIRMIVGIILDVGSHGGSARTTRTYRRVRVARR
jgi:hypothetical protein